MSDCPPDPQQLLKAAVGQSAAARVASGSVVGLGTGSTAAFAIEHLGKRLRSGDLTDVRGVATSFDAANLARQHGIPLTTLDDAPRIHVAIDGADEVDPDLALIKGGGAAHTQEKIIDAQADLFIVIVDDKKLVQRLGATFAVPVEVLPMAVAPVTRAIEQPGRAPSTAHGGEKDRSPHHRPGQHAAGRQPSMPSTTPRNSNAP